MTKQTPGQVIGHVKNRYQQIAEVDGLLDYKTEQAFAVQIIKDSTYMQKLMEEDPTSLRDAMIKQAGIGISLNPALKHAYLIPRKKKICLDLSYQGLKYIAEEAGSVQCITCKIVHENDIFKYKGMDQEPQHDYNAFDKKARGKVVGVYCTAKTADGSYLTETMTLEEVYEIRDKYSESWKAYQNDDSKKTPWVPGTTDELEMVKKTCIRRAYKQWPRSSTRMSNAVTLMDEYEGFKVEKDITEETVQLISQDQAALIQKIVDETKLNPAKIFKAFNIVTIKDIPADRFDDVMERLRQAQLTKQKKNQGDQGEPA